MKVFGTCIFCGKWGVLSGDHGWPDWMNEAFPGVRDPLQLMGTLGHPESETSWPTKAGLTFSHKIVSPCVDCNTQWMSRLETAVKSFIPPMARAEEGYPFNAKEQTAFAFWIFKTGLVQALMYDPCPVPLEHYAFAWTHGRRVRNWRLPRDVFIWLSAVGKFNPRTDGVVMSVFGDPEQVAPPSQPYIITMRLFHLVMRMLYDPRHEFLIRQIAPPFGTFLCRIWPTQRAGVWWPPETTLESHADFLAMATQFNASR